MQIDFRYVPTSGDLPGKSFEDQTEQAINELGGLIDESDNTANDAKEIAENAQNVANQALQEVQVAVDASNTAQEAASNAVNMATQANSTADIALHNSTEAKTVAATATSTANDAFTKAVDSETAVNNALETISTMDARVSAATRQAEFASNLSILALGTYTRVPTASISPDETDPVQFDANEHFSGPEKSFLYVDDSSAELDLPPLNFPLELTAPFYFQVEVNDNQTSATQRAWNTVNDDRLYVRTGLFDFATDPENPSILWSQWKFIGSDSNLVLSGAFLTRVIGGSTTAEKSLFPEGTIFIEGSTIIFDGNGTIGVYDVAIDSATISILTRSISPVSGDNPTLLGNVNTKADLPLTVATAETIFGRTPAMGDYAKVLADESKTGRPTVEYYITAIGSSANISWGNEVLINTSDYQIQSTAVDSGKALIGGETPGTFGASKGFDAAPTPGSQNLLLSGAIQAALQLSALGAAPANLALTDNAASDTLPTTSTGTVASKIQALRDNVKSLFSKVGAAIGLGGTPSTQAFSDTAAAGVSGNAARADHKHGMPAAPTSVSGNAGTATKLATARNLAVNLASTAAAFFDGSANQTSIPVSGTLPISSGGTGQSTAASARNALGLGNTTSALPIANGGTGATTAAAARAALGISDNAILSAVVLSRGIEGGASGSGNFSVQLPDGGTWAYFVFQVSPAGTIGLARNQYYAGIATGGTTIVPANVGEVGGVYLYGLGFKISA